jgi:hypothetical protein
VQGRSDPQRELLDVEAVAGHLLPSGGVLAFLAAHRDEVFPDDVRRPVPVGTRPAQRAAPVVASVLVLQALRGLSDWEAAEAVTFDLRWKAACGLAVTAPAFHPTTLTYCGPDWPSWSGRTECSRRSGSWSRRRRRYAARHGGGLDSTVLDDASPRKTR